MFQSASHIVGKVGEDVGEDVVGEPVVGDPVGDAVGEDVVGDRSETISNSTVNLLPK